ncbi:MAG: hypothetical protein V1798_09180 [Pseudomonadota bacterium]
MPRLEDQLEGSDYAAVYATSDLAAETRALEKIPAFRRARSFEKSAMRSQLRMDWDFVHFVKDSALLKEVGNPEPCKGDCQIAIGKIRKHLHPDNPYEIWADNGFIHVADKYVLTDLRPEDFETEPDAARPELPRLAPGVYSALSRGLDWIPFGFGEQLAMGANAVGGAVDAETHNRRVREVSAFVVAPVLAKLPGWWAAGKLSGNMARLRGNPALLEHAQAVDRELHTIEAARGRLESLARAVPKRRGLMALFDRMSPYRQPPAVFQRSKRVLSRLKGEELFHGIPGGVAGRVLSKIGLYAIVFVAAVDTADTLISLGQPRDVVIQKTAKLAADVLVGGALVGSGIAFPPLGVALTAVMIVSEIGHACNSDVPTISDATDYVRRLVGDGLRTELSVCRYVLRQPSLFAEDWMKFRNGERFDYVLIPQALGRASPADQANGAQPRTWEDFKKFPFTSKGFSKALASYPGPSMAGARDAIARAYAARYLVLAFEGLRMIGGVEPNRALELADRELHLDFSEILRTVLKIRWLPGSLAVFADRNGRAERDRIRDRLFEEIGGFLALIPSPAS